MRKIEVVQEPTSGVIPREGVESVDKRDLDHVTARGPVIPGEGVESGVCEEEGAYLYCRYVIPREGVERLENLHVRLGNARDSK